MLDLRWRNIYIQFVEMSVDLNAVHPPSLEPTSQHRMEGEWRFKQEARVSWCSAKLHAVLCVLHWHSGQIWYHCRILHTRFLFRHTWTKLAPRWSQVKFTIQNESNKSHSSPPHDGMVTMATAFTQMTKSWKTTEQVSPRAPRHPPHQPMLMLGVYVGRCMEGRPRRLSPKWHLYCGSATSLGDL